MSTSNNVLDTIKAYAVPYFRHTYHTKLSAEEIRERLLRNIDIEKRSVGDMIFRANSPKEGTYRGTFDGETFKIHRIKRGKNSNRPVVIGVINPSINTTQINVVMRLAYINVLGFIVSLGIFIYIMLGVDNGVEFVDFNVYFILFAMLFGYGITTVQFNMEATKIKKFLNQVLQPITNDNDNNWIIRN